MSDFEIVTQHPDMLKYIDYLQHKNAESLSFYPMQVFEREYAKQRLFLGILNKQPCGYLYVGAKGGDVKCHQVCIQYDLRNRLYGAMLVAAMENYAYNAYTITLRCGFDLDANDFWRALGYTCINVVPGGMRRNRQINVWRKVVTKEVIDIVPVEPQIGATDASIWVKNKRVGVVSQFHRGKALMDYRHIVVSGTEDIDERQNEIIEQADIFTLLEES
jgi:hypothetical protein